MTIAFMSPISAQVVDRPNVKVGLALLLPMLILGAASIAYWRVTERAGAGNVVPYAIVQGYAVVMLVLLAILHPSRYTRAGAIYSVFAANVLARILGYFDHEVFALGGLPNGHTFKHLAAAVSGLIVCRMLLLRTPRVPQTH